jgi:REP element-mobilizing transposase RayT
MLRGNGGDDIFHSDEDRRRFESLVAEGVERFGHLIHAFCWMTNHVHLAIQVGAVSLSRIVQNLAFRHARRVNERQGRTGHLFQGRYKAILVDADRYLLALVRYIHLNPVRAGLVERPEEYPWSSHRAYLGLERISWLKQSLVLAYFGGEAEGRRRYAAFMSQASGEDLQLGGGESSVPEWDIWPTECPPEPKATVHAPVVKPLDLERILIEVTRTFAVRKSQLLGPSRERRLARARQAFAYLTLSTGSGTLVEVSRRIHRDVATISNGVRRYEERCRRDERARAFLEELRANLLDLHAK